jgi:3-methyladenine DNA glycosylase AlkD
MTRDDVMVRLQEHGDEKIRNHNTRNGVGENQFGVKMGDLRVLAKEIKLNPPLAMELWETGNMEAMLLATLLMKPKELSASDLDRLVESIRYSQVADWLSSYIVKAHPGKEAHREKWMDSTDEMTRRMGWSLTTERVIKKPEGLDLGGLLDRIEKEMPTAPAGAQWTMNFCLGEIGINHPEHRARAIAIGEKIGAYKDYPVSKGCTSPYVPTWVAAMVARKV